MLLYLCFILGLKLFENHLSPSCSILGDWINGFTFLWFSIECKCTITLELHRNNSYGYVKDKKEVGHELSKKSLGMVKVLMLKVPFQLSNVLNSPHVSLTEFTIRRIMSHSWCCLYFIFFWYAWIWHASSSTIDQLAITNVIWHLKLQAMQVSYIPIIDINFGVKIQSENQTSFLLVTLIYEMHFLFLIRLIGDCIIRLTLLKKSLDSDKMHCSMKNQCDWHLVLLLCWAQY